jgi:hydrogenase maturation protein HypF
VQGVGFRPTIVRLARGLGLDGEVWNDADGVLVHAAGERSALDAFRERIEAECPPLARIESIEGRPLDGFVAEGFRIRESSAGDVHTEVTPDAVVCKKCLREVFDPKDRRFRYPFTSCSDCGPRLSIVTGIPYDRETTTMAPFALCPACAREFRDAGDRRFHAVTTACAECGPRIDRSIEEIVALLREGKIVALKGLGGFHLACDATNEDAVARLRARKRRDAKPFALMARDVSVIARYCSIQPEEHEALTGTAGPIVLLRADGAERLPAAIAPGLRTLGFMLPTTPLHALVLAELDFPLVMTSGNVSDEPQVTRDDDLDRLAGIADVVVRHDRVIANRVDDSVARSMGGNVRLLRRARGYAPAPIPFPDGFGAAPPLLAMGGDLKAAFAMLVDGKAIVSQHIGDLSDARTYADYEKSLELLVHAPEAVVHDRHPDYASSLLARRRGLPATGVQHHHAHTASCLVENRWPLEGPAVLGIILDGLGYGDDGAIWGGEFLLADYRSSRRLASLKPIAMLGGDQAAREPWRNLYAHLAAIGRPFDAFVSKPRALLDSMLRTGAQAPLASSCGRLFDAVAAALGIAFERQAYEGQAGALLENLASAEDHGGYPMGLEPYLDPTPMWHALLDDLEKKTPAPIIAARFHRGLADAVSAIAVRLASTESFDTVALSGGCFQNRLLFEQTTRALRMAGFAVLSHRLVPPNDGGLSLGQLAVGAARRIA